jgi:uncharacterized membrane protein YbaN (DUF454 family)
MNGLGNARVRRKLDLRRLIYLGIGWLSLGMAVAGVILPILPTTPFLLVAVWAFSKSSPELAEKIRNHRVFGPPVRNWQDHGVISTKAKSLAIAVMALMGGWLWFFGNLPVWLTLLIIAVMVGAGIYVGSRPSAPGRASFRE